MRPRASTSAVVALMPLLRLGDLHEVELGVAHAAHEPVVRSLDGDRGGRCTDRRRRRRTAGGTGSPSGIWSGGGTWPAIDASSPSPRCALRHGREQAVGVGMCGRRNRSCDRRRSRRSGRRTSRPPGRTISRPRRGRGSRRSPPSRARAGSSRSRSRICACTVTSSAVVGSSAMSSCGRQTSAIAIITRWRMPPENSCGYWSSRADRVGDADAVEHLDGAGASRVPAHVLVEARPPPASWLPTVKAGFRLDIGSWKTIAISPPRSRRMSSKSARGGRSPSKRIAPATMRPGGDGISRRIDSERHRLARARLADQADDLARRDGERDVVDDTVRALVGLELDARARRSRAARRAGRRRCRGRAVGRRSDGSAAGSRPA